MGDLKIKGTSGNHSSIDDRETTCGFGQWRPTCLNRCNNAPCLLLYLSIYAFTLGFVVNGINNVNTTSIERHFNLPSAKVGLISSAYDLSAAILGLIISYVGAGRQKARLVGVAVVISSFGSIIMALPHFISGQYHLGEVNVTSVCNIHNTSDTALFSGNDHSVCSSRQQENHMSNYLYVFILGQLLHGIGGTTIYTVGVSLLDDSIRPSSTPLYLGVLYGSAMLGPGLGYVVGGEFLSYYVDFDTTKTSLTQDDPQWVGAWWLGFLLVGMINVLVAVPICCFGAELPSAKKIRQSRTSEAYCQRKILLSPKKLDSGESTVNMQPEKSLKHFLESSLSLLCNPCFMFICMSMVTEGVVLSGVATFMPKMMENKFRVSASWAAILSGFIVVPSAALGQFSGGYIAKRMKLGIPGLIKVCILGMVLSLATGASVLMDCGYENFVGITLPYADSSVDTSVSLMSQCNSGCHCRTDIFSPVCDANGTLFFSPCYAGCSIQGSQDIDEFSNCSCVGGWTASDHVGVQAFGCRESCVLLYPFLAFLFLIIGFTMLSVAPGDSIQLRCVPEEDKTYAQGLKQLIVRCLGTMVGPVLMGRILDDACHVWRKDCRDVPLSCWLYDLQQMSVSVYSIMLVAKTLSITFCFLALYFYTSPHAKKSLDDQLSKLGDDAVDLNKDIVVVLERVAASVAGTNDNCNVKLFATSVAGANDDNSNVKLSTSEAR